MATIRGGTVRPHVQAFADEVERTFGINSFGTYPSHEPTEDRAVDSFGSRDAMLALAQWCTRDDVIDHFGIDYVMFDVNQTTVGSEIYNREISRSWRQVPDRGGATQNHHDHVHVSFEPTGSATPFNNNDQGDDMSADAEAQIKKMFDLWLTPGASGIPGYTGTGQNAFTDIWERVKNLEDAEGREATVLKAIQDAQASAGPGGATPKQMADAVMAALHDRTG